MISRVCSVWLVVLALSPFTAPFSTVDLAQMLGMPSDPGLVHSHATAVPLPQPIRTTRVLLGTLQPLTAARDCHRLVPLSSGKLGGWAESSEMTPAFEFRSISSVIRV